MTRQNSRTLALHISSDAKNAPTTFSSTSQNPLAKKNNMIQRENEREEEKTIELTHDEHDANNHLVNTHCTVYCR